MSHLFVQKNRIAGWFVAWCQYLSAVICLLSTCTERQSQSITVTQMKAVEFLHVSASLWHIDRWRGETWQIPCSSCLLVLLSAAVTQLLGASAALGTSLWLTLSTSLKGSVCRNSGHLVVKLHVAAEYPSPHPLLSNMVIVKSPCSCLLYGWLNNFQTQISVVSFCKGISWIQHRPGLVSKLVHISPWLLAPLLCHSWAITLPAAQLSNLLQQLGELAQ